MDTAKTGAVERISRVLAARHISANAKGGDPSAGDDVDRSWPEHHDDAISILKALREPDEAMIQAGDAAIWERMIAAALGSDLPEAPGAQGTEPRPPGTDPMHDGP
jgi:hypothetical protein